MKDYWRTNLPHLALGSLPAPAPACFDIVLGAAFLGLGPTRHGSPGSRIGCAQGPLPLSSAARWRPSNFAPGPSGIIRIIISKIIGIAVRIIKLKTTQYVFLRKTQHLLPKHQWHRICSYSKRLAVEVLWLTSKIINYVYCPKKQYRWNETSWKTHQTRRSPLGRWSCSCLCQSSASVQVRPRSAECCTALDT